MLINIALLISILFGGVIAYPLPNGSDGTVAVPAGPYIPTSGGANNGDNSAAPDQTGAPEVATPVQDNEQGGTAGSKEPIQTEGAGGVSSAPAKDGEISYAQLIDRDSEPVPNFPRNQFNDRDLASRNQFNDRDLASRNQFNDRDLASRNQYNDRDLVSRNQYNDRDSVPVPDFPRNQFNDRDLASRNQFNDRDLASRNQYNDRDSIPPFPRNQYNDRDLETVSASA